MMEDKKLTVLFHLDNKDNFLCEIKITRVA